MLNTLKQHMAAYPRMTAQDAVKLVFQARLGVGHLLNDKDAAMRYLLHEMDSMPQRSGDPLYETIGPDYVRLNLRAAKAKNLQPDWIIGMMLQTAAQTPCATRHGTLMEAEQTALACGFDPDDVRRAVQPLLNNDACLPGHSEPYREAYAPAYRVISSRFVPLMPILTALAAQWDKPQLLLTIDGPCGSGKSTLAALLGSMLDAPIIHTDDFYVPIPQKTAERLAIPGGNEDIERLMDECLLPWKQNGHTTYRPYNCMQGILLDPIEVPFCHVTILEGSYSNLPPVKALADVRVYLTIDRDTQLQRLVQRGGEACLPGFLNRWIPLEEAYHKAYSLPDDGCVVLAAPGTDVN